MAENGYTTKTTFWMDFTIADAFGIEAVRDTYRRAVTAWRNNVEYVSELVLVLNHKIWQHYQTQETLARVYDELWRELDLWCSENLQGEDAEYYFSVTD